MKPVKPAPGSTANYPTLRLGWRLLAAAPLVAPSIALADATVPKMIPDGKKSVRPDSTKPAPVKPKTARQVIVPMGGAMVAPDPPRPPEPPKTEKPSPKAKRQTPQEFPELDGGMGRVLRPRATVILFAELAPARANARALVIHPHQPGEPCAIIDSPDEEA